MVSFDAPLIRKDPRPQARGRLRSFGAFVSNAVEVRSCWLRHSGH
ncbi:hypothetical protein HanPI659440_Chr12g0466881 [Helianthus annuus]|nr:hypothetical protein HanPI659440_Chr12g0466881 [Helianthus annuus]